MSMSCKSRQYVGFVIAVSLDILLKNTTVYNFQMFCFFLSATFLEREQTREGKIAPSFKGGLNTKLCKRFEYHTE